jgi:CrcB protein
VTALTWLGVLTLGGLGSVSRFLVDGRVSAWLGRSFPFGTLMVNLSGAIGLGIVTGLRLDHQAAVLAGTATVGAYTTFSTWMFESQRLAEDRQARGAAANLVVSLVVGIAAAALGRWLGGLL